MISSRSLRTGAAALLALAGACSSDVTGPGTPPASLDQIFTEASLSSLSAADRGLSPVPLSTIAMPAPASCTYSAGSFICPTVTIGDLQVSRKFTLYDDNGVVQSQFVSGVTSRITFESSAHGTVTAATSSITVDQVHSLVLSGLTSSTHFLNGTSTTTIIEILPAGSTAVPSIVTLGVVFNNVALPKGAIAYPGSGSIDVSITSSDSPGAPVRMRLLFDGTSKVAVTFDFGAFSTEHCTIDLASSNPLCA